MQIELGHVSKNFGRIQALSDITLTIPSGRAVALVGPNGSGKSTLIRVLTGLVSHSGELRFNGKPRTQEVAQKSVYVPQIAPGISAPVSELVHFVCRVRELREDTVVQTAAELGLEIGRISKQPFKNLSGGMKQKLLLALALATPADLFVFDEPTASLDAQSREDFFHLCSKRRGHATLILCSHRIDEIRHLVDHVIALDEGRVFYDGPAAPYLSNRGEALVEVLVAPEQLAAWLRDRGFALGVNGWWGKRVSRADKLSLVREVTSKLDGQLQNIVVRDLERLDEQTGSAKNV